MNGRIWAALKLGAVVTAEAVAVAGLHSVSNVARWRVDWAHLWRWLDVTPGLDVAVGLACAVATALVLWQAAMLLLYLLAAATRAPRLLAATSPLTLPGIRRLVEASVAVTMSATILMRGGAAMAATGPAGGWAGTPRAAAAAAPNVPPAIAPSSAAPGTWTVAEGDNLWDVATAAIAQTKGCEPRCAEVGPYWQALQDANVDRLESRNPNLIQPGEVLDLPTIASAVPAQPAVQEPVPVPAPVAPPPTVPPTAPPATDPAPVDTVDVAPEPLATDKAVPAAPDTAAPDTAVSSAVPAEHQGAMLPWRGLLGGGLLSAGIVLALARRRSRNRHRGDEPERVLPPAPELADTELAAQVGADVDGARYVEVALRALAAQAGAAVWPQAVLLGDTDLRVIVAEPGEAPSPFTGSERVWTLDRRCPHDLEALAGVHPMPLPALATIGRAADGAEVMIDVEEPGLVSLTGPGARDLASAAGVQLATSPWGETPTVVLVGFDAAPTGRYVTSVDVLDDELLDELDAEGAERAAAVAAAGCESTFEARARDLAHVAWLPTVVVCRDAPPDAIARRLVAMCSSADHVGIAALVGGHVPESPWEIAIRDGRPDLSALGLEDDVEVAGLDEAATSNVFALLEAADSPPVAAPEPEAVADQVPSPSLLVRVMGPITVEGCGPIQRSKAVEALVYLACNRDKPVDRDRLVCRLWPTTEDVVKAGRNLNSTMTDLRRDLGKGSDGRPYVPSLVGGERLYRLDEEVGTDVDILAAAYAYAKSHDDADGRAVLRCALDLVRGTPFEHAGRGYEWAVADKDARRVETIITGAAHYLSTKYREAGEYHDAEWAATQGLVASPGSERLYRDIIEARGVDGDQGGVEQAWNELNDALEEIDVAPDPATKAVYDRVTLRKARSA